MSKRESFEAHMPSTGEDAERLRDQEPTLLAAVKDFAMRVSELEPVEKFATAAPRALLVGGYVRDVLLGGKPKDADIEVYGVDPDDVEAMLRQQFGEASIDLVGKSFGIIKANVAPGLDLDVSVPRRESKRGAGHRGFATEGDPSMTMAEAARRRDFTVNAMLLDPLTGVIFDPFGGSEDIKQRLLRVTDRKTFQDDPLRVMRAVQFAARFDFAVESDSLHLLKTMVAKGMLDELPQERMSGEWEKMITKGERPSVGLELMRELGIIERYYPELHALIDVPQDPEWHPEGDVWVHTLMVADQAAAIARRDGLSTEATLQLVLGSICHDLGKPSTTQVEDGRIRSKGHEEAGAEPTMHLFDRLAFSADIRAAAVTIAKEHLKPGVFAREYEKWLAQEGEEIAEKKYANVLRGLIKRIHPMHWTMLAAASEADARGRTIPGCQTDPYLPGELMARIIKKYELDKEPTKPLLQGRDFIELGVRPGKNIGELIAFVEALRDSGVIQTREQALAVVRESVLYATVIATQPRKK